MALNSIPVHHAQRSSLRAEIQSLPKIDLHRHLEGSLRLETMLEIISACGLDLPGSADTLRPLVSMVDTDARNPQVFLSKFTILRQFFQNATIIQRLVHEAVEDAARDGVRALELRFTPAALQQASGLSLTDVIDVVLATGQLAAAQHAVMLGLIVSVNRHESVQLAEEVVRIAVDRIADGIRGVDLAGDEEGFSVDPFIPVFAEARQAGLKLTIHAGEWGGASHVAHAIDVMAADRIGHGVRALEDPEVVRLARKAGVGFEVSPTSNFLTGVYAEPATYPLVAMIDAGLQVAITTDDPSIFSTTLTDEHALAVEQLGLSIETVKGLTLQALQLSFFNVKEQRALETEIVGRLWGKPA